MNEDESEKEVRRDINSEPQNQFETNNTSNNSEDVLESTGNKVLQNSHIYNLRLSTKTETTDESFTSAWLRSHSSSLKKAVEFLHEDKEFLVAAEVGNSALLQDLIRKKADIQQMDHLGRNALHLAVCADNDHAIIVLLNAGILPNVKDNLGMTPLSLCLMRRPSLKVANLLFDHGAQLLPRSNAMDTGLFLQFVMMCTPTLEEAKILELLTAKGALINDPEAPGGRQALHFAAMSDNCLLIQVLVDLGADLHLVNHRNETPKEVALTFKCKNAYAFLNRIERLNEPSSSSQIERYDFTPLPL